MDWIISFIWDYFKCKECDKYKNTQKELISLVNDLLKTQKEILKYIDLIESEEVKKVSGVKWKKHLC